MQAGVVMSKFAEIITIKTMTGTLLLNGEPSPGATKSSDATNAKGLRS
jgi:hypothetical protein